MPWLWIVAGPNGSGKTTLTRSGFIQDVLGEPLDAINPDDIAARMRSADPSLEADGASLAGARGADARVDARIADGVSVLIETVLSSDKLKARVERAAAAGFRIGLTFVVLETPDLSIARVRQRVAQAGHDVPEDKIRVRWARSIANLRWFAERADVVHVIDNSAIGRPALIAEKDQRGWTWHRPGRLPEIDAALGAGPNPATAAAD